MDALLGAVHTVNVCNNNFHLHKFQPRLRYSNLLGVDDLPNYANTEEGMLRMNTDTYYRLLNWGRRLAAGAGSATGAKQTPVGYNRTYVRGPEGASLADFNRAWAAGKNFVTNGPMLFLEVEDGKRPGEMLTLPDGGRDLRVKVEAFSNQPLRTVEIVVNGEVVVSIAGNDRVEVRAERSIPIREGSWLAARCVARDDHLSDEELRHYNRTSSLPEEPSRIRFAHTSPVYIEVNGRGARVRKSIDEGLRMMDALARYSEKNAGDKFRAGFLEEIKRAREILTKRRAESSHPMAAPGVTSLTNTKVRYESCTSPMKILKRGNVEAIIITNESFDGPNLPGHRAGYSGVASLKHSSNNRNLFVPAYAGLNFEHIHDGTTEALVEKFEPRRFPMELRVIDDHTVELYQPPTGNWKLESCGRYQLLEDGTIEYTFECIPRAVAYRNGYIGLFWASYIDRPEEKSIHFKGRRRDEVSGSRWIEAITPRHGTDSTHAPARFPELPKVDDDFPLTLVNHPSQHVYTEPWYFGVSHGMAFVQMFRERDRIWLAQSPSGGGPTNPAWDFQWFVPDPQLGQAYGFVMRAAFQPFESREQVERVTRSHRQALNP